MHPCSLAVVAFSLLASPLAGAAAQRTFVAPTGADANSCAITQPCRTFARALTQTTDGGEVIVLASGGYGPVTIDQSVSIIAPPGVYAGVSVFSGDGITICCNGTAIVTLRGLTITGFGGISGIRFQTGAKLTIEDCEISNTAHGAIELVTLPSVSRQDVTIKNTVMRGGSTGVSAYAASDMSLLVDHSLISDSEVGVVASALNAGVRVTMTVAHSTIARTVNAVLIAAEQGATTALLADGNTITESTIAFIRAVKPGAQLIYSPGNNTGGFITSPSNGAITACCAM